jgi:hypothetical protein
MVEFGCANMAIENLPRPWVLAALTGLRIADLLPEDKDLRPGPLRAAAIPEPRRRRLCEVAGSQSGGAGEQARLN